MRLSQLRVTEHRFNDDLLSAGLGLEGLRAAAAPALDDPNHPSAAALRRRAIYSSWRAIVDLSARGFGSAYGQAASVPGREFSAFAWIAGARHPHRVLAQIPDAFKREPRCLLVAPASGSRGIYGAIGLSGAWGLARGCAVVYTDKGAGTGIAGLADGSGVALDGTRSCEPDLLEFTCSASLPSHTIAMKHAHSQDNPEASWGEHVLQAARFGLRALDEAFPELAPFTPENTAIIAVGLSNGGGAVLRAAELAGAQMLRAVVAVAPNLSVRGTRPLYDYASEAALLQPCAMLAVDGAIEVLPAALWRAAAEMRGNCLKAAGLLSASSTEAQAQQALDRLLAGGWTHASLHAAHSNLAFDIWRSLLATYCSAYSRSSAEEPACGYRFALLDSNQQAREASLEERALWWCDSSGIAPTAGIAVLDPAPMLPDPRLPGLLRARELWTGQNAAAERLHTGVAEILATGKPRVKTLIVVHGSHDALIPPNFSSAPYVQAVRSNNLPVSYWRIQNAQHFDALLMAPPFASKMSALLPQAHLALDAVWATLFDGKALPEDR